MYRHHFGLSAMVNGSIVIIRYLMSGSVYIYIHLYIYIYIVSVPP